MKLILKDILKVYNFTKKKAVKEFNNANFNRAIHYISVCAKIANNFNWIYYDNELETLMSNIAKKILPIEEHFKQNEGNRYVFYDFRATENVCLTQQYLRALMSRNVKILYIPEVWNPSKNVQLYKELSNYPYIIIQEPIEHIDEVSRIKKLYKAIKDFAPDKILLQLAPWSAGAVILFNAFPDISKYYIDLTDHAFNLGVSCTDYMIEFRNRGCVVAKEKRNIKNERIFYLPYYPIISQHKFEGFPDNMSEDKIIMFSGGSFYKIYGDNYLYFKIVKRLLEENPNLCFLYVGMGYDSYFQKFIKENHFENRVSVIGYRKDINEIFQNIDIYLGTYPFAGGLMSQYAAINAKPILAYNNISRKSDFIESIICDKSNLQITYTDVNELCDEAHKLISNNKYREEKGRRLQDSLITSSEFASSLFKILSLKENTILYPNIEIDYNAVVDRYIANVNNNSNKSFRKLVLLNYKISSLFLFPKIVLTTMSVLFEFIHHPKSIIKHLIS